jgi:uncharacterized protein YdbL (DUF1318 family)
VAGCLTVNVYFPAPEIREAAEQVVEETWGDGSASKDKPDEGGSSSWLRILQPGVAHAAEPDVDINVSTAAIRKLKAAMSDRAAQLKPFLRKGVVGISNQGLLVIRDQDGLSLRDKAEVRKAVEAENQDRMTLYREIAQANNLSSTDVPRIQKIFADTWIEKAEPGWPVQSADGSWRKR